jgi:cytochrome c
MKILTALLAAATLSTAAHAAAPFAAGDPKAGKALHDKVCISCHVNMFGGDGSKIYTRADRKTKTAQQLAARISGCNANTGAGWFPEDEAHVAAYLNQQYYKFK